VLHAMNLRILFILLAAGLPCAAQRDVRLEELDLKLVKSLTPPMGWPAKAAQSVAGKPLTMKGSVYQHGVGLHSGSTMVVDLRGQAEKFSAKAGVDDERMPLPQALPGSAVPRGLQNHPGTATVEIWLDGKLVAQAGPLRRGAEPKPISADLRGGKRMTILITDGGRWPYNNPVDLADAAIVMQGASAKPAAVAVPHDPLPVIAAADSARVALHGPRVVGGSPGRPFLYRIPASGAGPLKFSASNLPAGLKLDPQTGFLSGALQSEGTTVARIEVSSPQGKDVRELRIVAGAHKLALTPPLGWNSWNVWARAVDDAKIRAAADWMVKSGLAAHGYNTVTIDDAWMGERDAQGEIHPNEKFADMKALADYVHSMGIKFGIYSSPGPKTCQQLPGSYQHEAQDAALYARWGVDMLKYDLCSGRSQLKDPDDPAEMRQVYAKMGDPLLKGPRDILFSLCEYGLADVGKWGPEVGGNLWRTTGDIRDSWESIAEIGFNQNGREKWAGPGHWNDPDMLVVGAVGWGVELHQSRLNPNEQMTHIGLWSLLASPLFLGCDLSQMDPFTLRVLTNDEVLDVNQDPLGKQASRKAQDGLLEVWAKPLEDGTMAVGLFNRGMESAKVTAKWTDIGVSGRQPVRDLWQRKNAGEFDGAYSTSVAPHGMALIKVGKATK
jgi:alpha-galactosidase